MSWLRNLTKPSIKSGSKRDMSADVFSKCPVCNHMNYNDDLAANGKVCTGCGYHFKIPLSTRLTALLDTDSAKTIQVAKMPTDPLKFKDKKPYATRLRTTQKKTNQRDAYQALVGEIDGVKVAICAMDFGFMGGSMGAQVGEAIVATAQKAVKDKLPLLLITASGGARMQESILSLMQMARTTAAIAEVKDAGLPYLTLLTDPTTGGVTASFAMIGDITIAEPGALIGFAGPKVIQNTIGETLPEGFQRAEYLLEHGFVDMILKRDEQRERIASVLKMLGKQAA